MNTILRKLLISMLAFVIASLSLQMPLAQAAMVSTEQVIEQQHVNLEREKIIAFLNRAEVQQELQQQGVSPEVAKARVAHLNDEEVAMLSGNIDALPAGGFVETVIGAAVFIFVVLLITDILGLTDIYPFVH